MLQNLLYNFPFIAALFWLLHVVVSRRPLQSSIRKVLILYMADSAILFFTFAATMQGENQLYLITRPLHIFSLSSIFPLYYIYLRLSISEIEFKPRYLWIFLVPTLLAVVAFVTLVGMTPQEVAKSLQYQYEGINAIHNEPGTIRTIINNYLQHITAIVILCEVLLMAVASIISTRKYCKTVEEYYANSYEKLRGVIRELTFVIILAIGAAVLMFTTGQQHFLSNKTLLVATTILSVIPLFIIGFHSQNRSFTIQELQAEQQNFDSKFKDKNNQTDVAQSSEESEEDRQPTVEVNIAYIAERIVEVIEKKELYLQTDLRITDVCDLLSTNRTYISQAINNHLGGNFSDFINRYRLEYAKQLLSDRTNDNYTIESLAEQAGFSTAASMNRTFRRIEGLTPHQFRQNSIKKVEN